MLSVINIGLLLSISLDINSLFYFIKTYNLISFLIFSFIFKYDDK